MPYYDLRCKDCGAEFNVRASVADRSEARIACPECGARALSAVYKTSPNVLIKKDAPACPHAAECGGCCPRRS